MIALYLLLLAAAAAALVDGVIRLVADERDEAAWRRWEG